MYKSVADFDKVLSLKANKTALTDLDRAVKIDYQINETNLKKFIVSKYATLDDFMNLEK